MPMFLWIVLIILGFLFHKSKKLAKIQCTFLILLMGFSSGTADYLVYKNLYSSIIYGSREKFDGNWIFTLFNYIVGKFTNFQFVLFTISLIGIILIYKSILYYTDSISLVLSLYMIAPFVIDVTQIKNFFAMSVWLYFSKYLYQAYNNRDRNFKANLVKYCFGVFLSMGIHTAFACTFIYIFVILFPINLLLFITIFAIVVFNSIGLTAIKILLTNMQFSNNNFFRFIYAKFVAYSISFDADNTIKRIYLTLIFIVLFGVGIMLIINFRKKNSKKEFNFLKFVISLNIINLWLIPLFFLSMEFYRFQRNLILLDYIAFQMFLDVDGFYKLKQKVCNIVLFAAVFVLAFYYLYIDAIHWNYDVVFSPLFRLK